jgi:ABC-type uncharacterized transport system permease subunit
MIIITEYDIARKLEKSDISNENVSGSKYEHNPFEGVVINHALLLIVLRPIFNVALISRLLIPVRGKRSICFKSIGSSFLAISLNLFREAI